MAAKSFPRAAFLRFAAGMTLLLTAALPGSVGAEAPKPVRILAFGDSLVAGFGLASRDGFTTKLEAALKAKGVPVLFAGMYAPPNLGPDYGKAFNALYPELAAKHAVLFYPFFLDGVAADATLNQADGIHPNAKGVDVIVARILPHVLKLVGKAS